MEVEDEMKTKDILESKQHLHGSQSFENNVNNVSGEQPVMNGRRQSTRNRPPTTKALEALACGFLSVKKGRSTKTSRPSRSSRRIHKNSEVSLPASDTDLSTSHITVAPSVGTDEFPSVGWMTISKQLATRASLIIPMPSPKGKRLMGCLGFSSEYIQRISKLLSQWYL